MKPDTMFWDAVIIVSRNPDINCEELTRVSSGHSPTEILGEVNRCLIGSWGLKLTSKQTQPSLVSRVSFYDLDCTDFFLQYERN